MRKFFPALVETPRHHPLGRPGLGSRGPTFFTRPNVGPEIPTSMKCIFIEFGLSESGNFGADRSRKEIWSGRRRNFPNLTSGAR